MMTRSVKAGTHRSWPIMLPFYGLSQLNSETWNAAKTFGRPPLPSYIWLSLSTIARTGNSEFIWIISLMMGGITSMFCHALIVIHMYPNIIDLIMHFMEVENFSFFSRYLYHIKQGGNLPIFLACWWIMLYLWGWIGVVLISIMKTLEREIGRRLGLFLAKLFSIQFLFIFRMKERKVHSDVQKRGK